MIKVHVINTFACDSLALRVAVFDGNGKHFRAEDYKIDRASLQIGQKVLVEVEYAQGHIIDFFVDRDMLCEPGSHDFQVQVFGDGSATRFTVATGRVVVLPLPLE